MEAIENDFVLFGSVSDEINNLKKVLKSSNATSIFVQNNIKKIDSHSGIFFKVKNIWYSYEYTADLGEKEHQRLNRKELLKILDNEETSGYGFFSKFEYGVEGVDNDLLGKFNHLLKKDGGFYLTETICVKSLELAVDRLISINKNNSNLSYPKTFNCFSVTYDILKILSEQ